MHRAAPLKSVFLSLSDCYVQAQPGQTNTAVNHFHYLVPTRRASLVHGNTFSRTNAMRPSISIVHRIVLQKKNKEKTTDVYPESSSQRDTTRENRISDEKKKHLFGYTYD